MVVHNSEALGQLGQDEPASGMALEPLVAFAPIAGSVAIALHHRNSKQPPVASRWWTMAWSEVVPSDLAGSIESMHQQSGNSQSM